MNTSSQWWQRQWRPDDLKTVRHEDFNTGRRAPKMGRWMQARPMKKRTSRLENVKTQEKRPTKWYELELEPGHECRCRAKNNWRIEDGRREDFKTWRLKKRALPSKTVTHAQHYFFDVTHAQVGFFVLLEDWKLTNWCIISTPRWKTESGTDLRRVGSTGNSMHW